MNAEYRPIDSTGTHKCPKCGLGCRVHESAKATTCPKCGRVFPTDRKTALTVRQYVATLGSQALQDVAEVRWTEGALGALYASLHCRGIKFLESAAKASAEHEASFQLVA